MKQFTFLVLALAWFFVEIGSFPAADAPKEDAVKKELARFDGTWGFVSIEVEGMKVPEEEVKKSGKLVIKGGKFTLKEGDSTYEGTFKVDLSKKPKQIDVTFTEGPDKGKTFLGIYEVEGDTYKNCIGMAGKDRPTEFTSKPGSGHVLEVLKRELP